MSDPTRGAKPTPPYDGGHEAIEEARWVADARQGDSAAFGELVRKYQRRAVSVAFRVLGNSEDAWDVAQDAFVRAYRNLGQLDNPGRFGPWLMRIVSNLSLNFRRSRKSRAAAQWDDPLEAVGEFRRPQGDRIGAGDSPAEAYAAGQLSERISRAMDALPEKQRLALILFSVEGWPQKDVAAIMDCSVELVKWNVFQARKKLRELLGDDTAAE